MAFVTRTAAAGEADNFHELEEEEVDDDEVVEADEIGE